MEKTGINTTIAAEATRQVAAISPIDNGQNGGKLLSPEAFVFYRKDPRVLWGDICKAFANRSNGPVTLEEYRTFYQAWMEKNNILLTQDAYQEWRQHGGLALISLKEIKEKTGKSSGVTPEELLPILEDQEVGIGFSLDGEAIECYRCAKKFQPIAKILIDWRGKPVFRRDGTYARCGNFLGIRSEVDGKAALFVVVAICYKCHNIPELRRQLTFPRQEAENYVCRQNQKMTRAAKATEEILRSIQKTKRGGSRLSENVRVNLLKKC